MSPGTATWLSVALDAAAGVGLVVVAWRIPRRVLAATLVAAALLWLAKLRVLGAVAGVDPFGAVRHVFFDAAVAVPAAAAAALGLRRGRRLGPAVAAVALLGAPAGAYAAWIEPRRLEVTETRVDVRGDRPPLRVVVVADLQTERPGRYERDVARRVRALRPDLVLLPGDLHQGDRATYERELMTMRGLLRGIGTVAPSWFVLGDAEGPVEAEELLAGTGVRLLVDGVDRIRLRGRSVAIGGLGLDTLTFEARRAMVRLARTPADMRLLVSHRPDSVLQLPRGAAPDLVVAGHTHGGQVAVPVFGPPFTATAVPRDVAAGGLHRVGGTPIYVSRGIGMERGQAPRVRFGVRPELALLLIG